MTSGFFTGDVLRGLAVRVLFFLSLALLPIGLIAISQTQQIAEQNRLNAELSLLAITRQAATAETLVLQDALGAARALSSIVKLHRDDPEQCRAFFRTYNAAHERFAMVGFVPVGGLMVCSSSENAFDFSDDPYFQEAIAEPRLRTQTIRTRANAQRPVIIVTSPVFEGETLEGFIALSIPFESFERIEEPDLPSEPLALMTFNSDGQIISSESELSETLKELPAEVRLADFIHHRSAVFEADNESGQARVYALQPIVSDAIFALSVWPTDTAFLNPSIISRLVAVLPIVMWAATLVVAFWALNRLAIRHIQKLGRQMRRFALNRHLPNATLGAGVPTELIEM
ncbi:MAG: cache domain-containing protein, partial [Pseudomonadota bacterium]